MKKILLACLLALPVLAETKVRDAITLGAPVNVCDKIGAICPSGGDDKVAIQLALTAATGGKVVYFPPGTYKLSGQIVPVADTTMVCDGLCTFVPTGGYTGAAIKVNFNGITVRGFTFDGFDQVVDADSITGLVIEKNHVKNGLTGIGDIANCTSVRVLDNFLEAVGGICIDIEDSRDVVVSRNVIRNCGNDGIAVRTLVTSPGEMVVITDNIIDDAGKAGIKFTVETLFSAGSGSLAGSQNLRATISNNVIHGWGLNVAESGISVYNHLLAGEKNQAIVVANNVIESKARANEVQYIDAIYVTDAAITGNIGRGGVTLTGISLYNSTRTTVMGNVISTAGTNSALTTIGGIALLVSNYNTVIGNTIRNVGSVANKHPGIYAEQSQYNVLIGNIAQDETATTMTYGIEMNSAGATKNDFNVLIGNISTGHVTGALFTGGALQQHQIAIGNQDGVSGGITLLGTAAAKTSGVRNASTRNITRTTSVAPVDCAAGNIAATVTQELDSGIFTCATAQTLTTARADGSSGIVQALPGIPAVGDVFEFVMSSTAAANFTLVAGLSTTLVGNAVVNNSSRVVTCRITAVTLNSETITCYL